ncbi:ABC exporter membrane fusion protein [Phormidium tenue FACHB-886]|nr:ABC exporter membrane fusion protein [Phormidium tenue FACHB-886]
MTSQLFLPKNRWALGLIIASTIAVGGAATYALSEAMEQAEPTPAPAQVTAPKPPRVSALGRLQPESEVIKLSAPRELDGDRIAQVLVKEGDRVQVGQVIAVLDSKSRLEDALLQAQEEVGVAQAKLAQVQAGAKSGEIAAQQAAITRLQAERSGEIAAQQAEIERWESEVRNAQAEFQRYEELYQQGAISVSTLDSKRLPLETAEAQLAQVRVQQGQSANTIEAEIREAQATLDQIAEVRPVDVQAAQAEVEQAIAAVKKAETELAQAYVRAPIAGQILKVHSRAGEQLSSDGIAEMAQTDRMTVVAEVYQSDIGRVKTGQTATVTGQAIPGELRGEVYEIGLQVDKQNVYSNEPGENLDRRIVEVKIRLNPESSREVAGLTNMQVQTAIAVEK